MGEVPRAARLALKTGPFQCFATGRDKSRQETKKPRLAGLSGQLGDCMRSIEINLWRRGVVPI
jgi:hypothetical protein